MSQAERVPDGPDPEIDPADAARIRAAFGAADYTELSGVFALYAHNDWRVRNNLTLNLGL